MRRTSAAVLAAAIVLVAAVSTRLYAQDPPKPGAAPPAADAAKAKAEKVRKLLRLQGQDVIAKQMIDKMMTQFQQMPMLPPGFIEKFRERARMEDLMELTVVPFAKRVDDETLDATIVFFESPAGRKLSAAMPAIANDASDAGAAWGRKVAEEVLSELGMDGGK